MMGANQSQSSSPPSSSPSSSMSRGSLVRSSSSSSPFQPSRSSAYNPSYAAMDRSNAVRHRTTPPARPGSRREFLLQQQQLLQTVEQEYIEPSQTERNILSGCHTYSAMGRDDGEEYFTYAIAEVPGFYMNQGGCQYGATGPSLSRTHAVRSLTSPVPQLGSRRERMHRASSSPSDRAVPVFSHSSRTSRASRPDDPSLIVTASSTMVSFNEMGVAAPASPFTMSRTRVHGESRFQEEL
ncbi:hypothetical protein SEPCBS57363_006041 [Sporothrix epigloea]|uniref:Uncharacterized protein n=1 Tax=Sporothrix epigloea TaxID=1892477 RepID=A0ABP0E1A3_9PEZI